MARSGTIAASSLPVWQRTGIGFEEYFGDALMSSFDNMVDRAPEGRLEVAGPPLRYMHQCNWKMLVDNQTDTCHPMVAHESSAGTAVKLFEEANWPEDKPKPMAMEIIAPFMSPYEFFEEMGIRTWPNGHGHTGVHHSIHSDYSQIAGLLGRDGRGPRRGKGAKAILGENRHNTVYWPNIMIKGPVQQLRNFIPLGPDKTLVESYVYRLVGAPDYLLQRTAMYNRLINAPTSMVGHDDLEMYERAQEGLHSGAYEWINIQRLFPGEERFDEEAIENGTTERQMRNQMHAWVKFMTMTMEQAARRRHNERDTRRHHRLHLRRGAHAGRGPVLGLARSVVARGALLDAARLQADRPAHHGPRCSMKTISCGACGWSA